MTLRARTENAGMLETSTNGAGAAVEAAAAEREDQRGVAGLAVVAGARAAAAGAPGAAGLPDPELVEQAKRRSFTAKYKLEILRRGRRVHSAGRGRRAAAP